MPVLEADQNESTDARLFSPGTEGVFGKRSIRTSRTFVLLLLIAGGAGLAPSPAAAQPIPVHQYRFPGDGRDTGSLGTGTGVVGANVTFTDSGVPGGIGRATVFAPTQSAVADYITVPNAGFVNFGTGNFTIAFWAKRTTIDGSAHGVLDALNGSGVGWQIQFTTANLLSCRIDGSTGSSTATLNSTMAIADSGWHHYAIVVTRSSATGFLIYIDGAVDATGSTTGVTGSIDPDQETQIGGLNNTAGLGGQLALVQIYTSALSAANVVTLVAVGHPIHQYEFEGNGNDSAGIANGTAGGNVTFTTSGVPPVLGQAATFGSDGSTAARRIDVPTTNFAGFGMSNFSISCWVKRDVNDVGQAGILDALNSGSGVQMQIMGSDEIRLRIDDDAGQSLSPQTTSTLTDVNQWHHILFSVNRSVPATGIQIYIDGVNAGSADPSTLTGNVNFDQTLQIGAINGNGLQGKLARLSFFTSALTAIDAQNLADLDGDGVADITDICPGGDDLINSDSDGIPDACDNCPAVDNVSQTDADGDGVGDTCDNCPSIPNGPSQAAIAGIGNQTDREGDGLGDACDPCVGTSNVDGDGDGVCDEFDACPGPDSSCTVPAGVICVWAASPGSGTGTNWYNAYHNLRDAQSAAIAGQQIWVAAGTYYPDGGYQSPGGPLVPGSGFVSASFTLKPGVALYGGFKGNESLLTQRDWTAHVSTLSGEIQGNGKSSDNSHQVVKVNNSAGPDTVLDGFTISGGYADGGSGAGLYNEGGKPTLINCTFSGNKQVNSGAGGGFYSASGAPTLTNCTFSGNTGMFGSGLSVYTGSASITDCTFTDNYGSGGCENQFGSVTLTHCTFSLNQSGFRNSSGAATVSNCVFTGNESFGLLNGAWWSMVSRCTVSGNGGYGLINYGGSLMLASSTLSGNARTGLYNDAGSVTLTNCTLSGNQEGGVVNDDTASISNSILWGNSPAQITNAIDAGTGVLGSASVLYSIVQGGWPGGLAIKTANPKFVDADGPDNNAGTPDDNLQLNAGSPAIDAGIDDLVPNGITLDVDGNPRFISCHVDMGAYEYVAGLTTDTDGDGYPDNCDICPNTIPGALVTSSGCPEFITGDFDRDGDVDTDDVSAFKVCETRSTIPSSPACETRDLDYDDDVDMNDFAILQRCYSGANVPGNPYCDN